MARLSFVLAFLAAAATKTLAQQQNGAPSQQACEAATLLAQGIAINIMDQKNEQGALAQVAATLNQNPVNAGQFNTAKSNLINFINIGIAIRQMNQQITPLGNKATAGLAKVANAQLEELNLAMGLTGTPATDQATVSTLQKDFAGGIQVNQANMMAAMEGCGIVTPNSNIVVNVPQASSQVSAPMDGSGMMMPTKRSRIEGRK